MKDFNYYCPTRVVLGKDSHLELENLCQNEKVLLMYGGQSLKKNGVYDLLTSLFVSNHIPFVEFGGVVDKNYETYLQGIEICRKEQVTCVIGVGGAIVMDTAKIVAFGAEHDDLNHYLSQKIIADNSERLLIILIPTYPSTGSETDDIADAITIDGKEGRLKGVFADYALLNPEFTYSLDKKNTALSAMVTFIQASVYYFDNDNKIAKGFAETVLKTVLESYQILLENLNDYDARANIMWASAATTMGVLDIGMNSAYPWSVYSLGLIPCRLHHLSYREGVTLMYPYWLKYMSHYHMDDIKQFLVKIFDIDQTLGDNKIIEKGYQKIKDLMSKGDIPAKATVYGSMPEANRINEAIDENDDGNLTKEELLEIIKESYRED
ncbi:MAG: iron-containing alcohol dehydrogenase [Lachnospiraceae bacterium]